VHLTRVIFTAFVQHSIYVHYITYRTEINIKIASSSLHLFIKKLFNHQMLLVIHNFTNAHWTFWYKFQQQPHNHNNSSFHFTYHSYITSRLHRWIL